MGFGPHKKKWQTGFVEKVENGKIFLHYFNLRGQHIEAFIPVKHIFTEDFQVKDQESAGNNFTDVPVDKKASLHIWHEYAKH